MTPAQAWSVPDRVREQIRVRAEKDSFEENPCFYLYDLEAIEKRVTATVAALPEPFAVYYAMKANPYFRILDLMANHPGIAGVDVSSGGELQQALRFFRPAEISFTGPAKLPVELRLAVDAGIGRIHLESLVEAERLNSLARRPVRTSVRLTSPSSSDSLDNGEQFGIREADYVDCVAEIACLPNVPVDGVHSFPGSGMLDTDDAVRFAIRTLTVAQQVQHRGVEVRAVNVGGGFGISYNDPALEFDIRGYGSALQDHRLIRHLELDSIVVDLGRFLVAKAGYYVTEIVDIKHSRNSVHLITAGGINHQRRPYAHSCNMPIAILNRNLASASKAVRDVKVTVNGPTLASYDTLGRDVWIDRANIGDLLVLGLAGAYGLNLAPTEFLLRPRAAEYALA